MTWFGIRHNGGTLLPYTVWFRGYVVQFCAERWIAGRWLWYLAAGKKPHQIRKLAFTRGDD